LPRAYTKVFAVPKSIARSLENTLNSERTPCVREEREWKPFDDMNAGLILTTDFIVRPRLLCCTATLLSLDHHF
jgi:hypothetical protein